MLDLFCNAPLNKAYLFTCLIRDYKGKIFSTGCGNEEPSLESRSSIMAERIGHRLGNYQLIRLLGRGGFAEVYLGEHIYLKTEAAIKVLHTHLAGEDIEQFRTEAATIAHLVHPHIIRVLDFDVDDGTPLLVMDYAPNSTLRLRHPKGKPLPPSVFLPYVRQVASALQYAHDQKFIHRDVKPENMLLNRNNEVLLSDFGIALVTQNSLSQSTENTVVGTMAYMAPEQIQGKPRPASDQYALAVVVYEWISGQKPFNGSDIEIVTQHLSAPPPPLDERTLAIPHAVQQVIQRALAKDPHQRFPRVQDFADALERAYSAREPAFVVPVPAIVTPPYSAYGANKPVYQQQLPVVGGYAPQAYQQAIPNAVNMPRNNVEALPSSLTTTAKRVRRGLKRGVRVLLIVIVLLSLLVCGLIYGVTHYFQTKNAATPITNITGANALSTDFMQAVMNSNYDQAYNDLGPQVTGKNQFKQSAQSEDRCDGTVKTYQSTGVTQNGNTVMNNYLVKRTKVAQPYHLTLTLQGDGSGRWQITDYNSDAPLCHS